MMRRVRQRVRVAAALALSLVFIAPLTAYAADRDASAVTVRIALTPNDDVTPLVYAQRTGMFARAKLNIVIDKLSSGAAVGAAILGGSYDIGKASITVVFDAHEKGLPFTIVAPAAVYESASPFGGMIVAAGSTIRTAKDFEGKIVGVQSLNDIGRVSLDSFMQQSGADWRAIKYVEIPMSAVNAALEQHRIDAGELVYPGLATAIESNGVRVIPQYSALGKTFLFSVWISTTDWANAHREAIRSFARILATASAYTNAHHAETAAMMADFTGIPLAVISKMTRVKSGTDLDPAQIQPGIDAAVRDGTIAKPFLAQEIINADGAAAMRLRPSK